MRSKTVILLVLALGCGLVASIGISQMLQRQDQPAGDTSPVWVVKTDIKQNEPLTMQNLALEQWPKEKIPPGTLGKMEEIEGKRARVNLYAGEPILDKKLLSKDQISASFKVPPGFRLFTVTADAVSSFGGLLHPEDRVDVLLYVAKANGIARTGTKTILQDIKVFAVNDVVQNTDDQATQSITAKTVTLLVTPSQAEKLVLANEIGKIKLVMRSPDDKGNSTPDGATEVGLFSPEKSDRDREDMNPPANPKAGLTALLNAATQSQSAAPQQPAVAEPRSEPVVPPETFAMQIIRGAEMSEIDFRKRMDDPTRWDNGTSTSISGSSPSTPEASDPPASTSPAPAAKSSNATPNPANGPGAAWLKKISGANN